MYSYEILNLLKQKQYLLEAKEYLEIVDTSPQIKRVHYEPYNDTFEIDTKDNYNFKFKVKKRGN